MADWFRSWHGAPTDPKWLGVAKRAGVAPGIAVAIAWALMDRASQSGERGSIDGYDADGLACFFGCETEQVEAVIAAMQDKGVISGDRFAAWEKRQPKREDDSSTERVRAHRAAKKAAEQENETRSEMMKRDETQRNAPKRTGTLDTDTDTEIDNQHTASLPREVGRAGADPAPPDDSKSRSVEADFRTSITRTFEAAGVAGPDTSRAAVWLHRGWSPGVCLAVISETLARKKNVRALGYFEAAIAEAHTKPEVVAAAKATEPIPDDVWRKRLKRFAETEYWPPIYGPRPGLAGCAAPPELVASVLRAEQAA